MSSSAFARTRGQVAARTLPLEIIGQRRTGVLDEHAPAAATVELPRSRGQMDAFGPGLGELLPFVVDG